MSGQGQTSQEARVRLLGQFYFILVVGRGNSTDAATLVDYKETGCAQIEGGYNNFRRFIRFEQRTSEKERHMTR
jgi:hypothetical protein